ncbi:MAG: chorismate synthase [Bacteroidia bacterium]|nr:chorismate synthase [Bacteroidia bacterium]MDW8015686.1 chorismate synthase [Bacteroidia bacterium]
MNTFGRLFRITTFGESHGPGIGVVIDGIPAGLPIDLEAVQGELARRRPGQSPYTTPRQEPDALEVLSGLYEGKTTGAPLALWIPNRDAQSEAYEEIKEVFRPSHADFTYFLKYRHTDPRGGGRSSARETAARVAAGAIALQLLQYFYPKLQILSWTSAIGPYETLYIPSSREEIEASPVRCPDKEMSKQMQAYIEQLQSEGDTTGGIITTQVEGMPAGLGEPLYDKLSARLAYAMLSINATKGFEVGEGFRAARLRGSEHNDSFTQTPEGRIRPATNHAGGLLGGISTGEALRFRVAFKPISSLQQPQVTMTRFGKPTVIKIKGRHDPCPIPRAVPVVEAMTAIVLADFLLLSQSGGYIQKRKEAS